jgi:hypothetical protein
MRERQISSLGITSILGAELSRLDEYAGCGTPRDHLSLEMDALFGVRSINDSLFISALSAGGPADGIGFIHQNDGRHLTIANRAY